MVAVKAYDLLAFTHKWFRVTGLFFGSTWGYKLASKITKLLTDPWSSMETQDKIVSQQTCPQHLEKARQDGKFWGSFRACQSVNVISRLGTLQSGWKTQRSNLDAVSASNCRIRNQAKCRSLKQQTLLICQVLSFLGSFSRLDKLSWSWIV